MVTYNSIIKNLFFGILNETFICSICGKNSNKSDSFLNIEVTPSLNIINAIQTEWRQNIEKTCQICNQTTEHLLRTSIQLKPNILVILLKRFKTLKSGRITKLTTEITLPDKLDIPGFSGDLIGFIDHIGVSPHSGHYVSNVKINNTWYLCNDASININKKYLNSKSPYMAFYKLD